MRASLQSSHGLWLSDRFYSCFMICLRFLWSILRLFLYISTTTTTTQCMQTCQSSSAFGSNGIGMWCRMRTITSITTTAQFCGTCSGRAIKFVYRRAHMVGRLFVLLYTFEQRFLWAIWNVMNGRLYWWFRWVWLWFDGFDGRSTARDRQRVCGERSVDNFFCVWVSAAGAAGTVDLVC